MPALAAGIAANVVNRVLFAAKIRAAKGYTLPGCDAAAAEPADAPRGHPANPDLAGGAGHDGSAQGDNNCMARREMLLHTDNHFSLTVAAGPIR